jgi:hypothetical protein
VTPQGKFDAAQPLLLEASENCAQARHRELDAAAGEQGVTLGRPAVADLFIEILTQA